MRVNTAQVRAGEHIGSLRRVVLGQAEMQKNARAEFAQHFDGKDLGLHVGHVHPHSSVSSVIPTSYAGSGRPRVSAPKGISSRPTANAKEVSATGTPSEP